MRAMKEAIKFRKTDLSYVQKKLPFLLQINMFTYHPAHFFLFYI